MAAGRLPVVNRRRVCMAGACSVALLASCDAPAPRREAAGPLYWPAPPEQPRYAWETTLRTPGALRDPAADDLKRRIVGEVPEANAFVKPFAVAARSGRIYVTDTLGRSVGAYDVPRRRYFRFGYRYEGTLATPVGVAVDAAGRVYVADSRGRRVVVYDGYGLYQRSFGGESELVRPAGVAVEPDGSRVYVVDAGGVESDRHRVVAFGPEGRMHFSIGRRGAAQGDFNLPVGAAVAPDGILLVLDAGNFRVQAFDREGRFLRAFGELGSGLGQFARPRGIAVDPDGNVYVTDASFAVVQVFDAGGNLLLPLGHKHHQDGPGRLALPAGVAVDETRRVYVVDQFFNKLEVLRRLSDAEGGAVLDGGPGVVRR